MIRVAVAGAGHWGPNLIRNFHNLHTSRVVAVVDTAPERLAQVAQRFPDIRLASDLAQTLRDIDVDAVVIATPTSSHYELAKIALEAGAHVLVEKPLATTSTHCEELAALATRARRILMVGHVFCYNGAVQRVRQLIDDGRLGRLFYMSMVRTNFGPIRVDVNAAWDLASHDIAIADYWLGTSAVSVSASAGSWINPGIHDAVFATLRYPKDIIVNLHVSWLNPRKARDITVVGDQRMLTFDDMNLNEPLRIYDKQVTDERSRPGYVDTFASFRASIRDGDITIPKVATGEPLRAECDHFLACVQAGSRPISGASEGTAVVRVLEAMDRSIRNVGREETVAS